VLILSRLPGEIVMIGSDIKITIIDVDGYKVRIGFDASPDIVIDREEIFARKLVETAHGRPPRKGSHRNAKA
jgi:carbon storage regulator